MICAKVLESVLDLPRHVGASIHAAEKRVVVFTHTCRYIALYGNGDSGFGIK